MVNHKRKVAVILSTALVTSMLAIGGVVSAQSKSGEMTVLAASQQYQKVNVVIDGVLQTFDQSAIVKNGSTMVPLRGVFEALKAEVEWNQATRTVTATKDTTTIILGVDETYAFVNLVPVELAAKAEIINGSTMVPLRFVSEALGARVDWNAETFTATITSGVNGIVVLYGKHTYGSKNQAEYDKVMEIINEKVKTIDTVPLDSRGRFEALFEAYLYEGDRAANYPSDSNEHRGLTLAHGTFGPLLEAGLTADQAAHAYRTSMLATSFIPGNVDSEDFSKRSAFDSLVHKVRDCYSEAHIYSSVFDVMGYNTAIFAAKNHADGIAVNKGKNVSATIGNRYHSIMVVKISNIWYTTEAGHFYKVDLQDLFDKGLVVHGQPTNGAVIKK
ncbi:copper amine oxidase N-terminal domain-containing protein [Paenibacillus hodogayensis]|uniref:Copper amine oxidase N-terminal domain-containing protein n=1 Tax=Paenibacillus hodogayensis TaxID=279208 RepID=A0ABV5W8M2_9BACL